MRNHQPPTTRPAPSLHLQRRTAALQRWGLIYFSNDSFNGMKTFSNECMKWESLSYCVWIANVVPAQNKFCLLANSRFSWGFFLVCELRPNAGSVHAVPVSTPQSFPAVPNSVNPPWCLPSSSRKDGPASPHTHSSISTHPHTHTFFLSNSWTASLIPIKYVLCDWLLAAQCVPSPPSFSFSLSPIGYVYLRVNTLTLRMHCACWLCC